MKTIISFLTIVTFMTVSTFGQNSNVNSLLEKPETRKEIINGILNNHNYMSEFMKDMHGNQHAMMMMNGSEHMMGNQNQMKMNGEDHMMDRSYMMNMMKNDPASMQMMINSMTDAVATDSVMSRNMVNRMYSHPQMVQMMNQDERQHGMTGSMNYPVNRK